ncbi:MAG: hypothetical protein WKF85_10295 [Chitinophagaceae bacterium]
MRKIFFENAYKLIISALLVIFTGISCKKNAVQIPADNGTSTQSASQRATGSAALQTISLIVSVNDAAGNNITSDGKGDYLNGVDYVQAILDGSGTFAFNTLNSRSTKTVAKRWVNYNLNSPVDPNNTYRPSPSNTKNYHFSTGGSVYGTNPFIPLQNLGVNGNPATQCIYMGNGIYNSTTGWRVSFHKGYEDISNSPTSFAVVTRTSLSPAVWTITPIGSCSPNSNVAALRSQDGTLLYGYYYLPFYFTLRAQ